MLIPIIGLLCGIVLGILVPYTATADQAIYIAIAILAGFDSVLGGTVANLNKKFDLTIFMSGFFFNAFISAIIVFFGSKLGLDLYIAVVVVFVMRIFQNFAIIRRFLLNKYKRNDIIQ